MKKVILGLISLAGILSILDLFKKRGDDEKEIEIKLDESDNGCRVKSVNPPVRNLTRRVHKVRWVVHNDCDRPVSAVVDDFKSEDPPDPSKKRPFGPDAKDNEFDFETIKPGKKSRLISKIAKGENPDLPSETYKYKITITWGPGPDDTFVLDPRVVIGN